MRSLTLASEEIQEQE